MSGVSVTDILAAESRGSGGFGLYGHACRRPYFWSTTKSDPYAAAALVDRTVAIMARVRGWNAEKLHAFMGSKIGRYCGDGIAIDDDERSLRSKINVSMDVFNAEESPVKKHRRRRA